MSNKHQQHEPRLKSAQARDENSRHEKKTSSNTPTNNNAVIGFDHAIGTNNLIKMAKREDKVSNTTNLPQLDRIDYVLRTNDEKYSLKLRIFFILDFEKCYWIFQAK